MSELTTMRDAEEDEETRVLDATVGLPPKSRPSAPSVLKRQPGLPPPLLASAVLPDVDDEEATRLIRDEERKWSISDGPAAPRDLTHRELLQELKAGSISGKAFAWCKGMKEWQRITSIPSLSFVQKASGSSPSKRPPPPPPQSLLSASAKLSGKPERPTAPSNQAPPKTPPPTTAPPKTPPPTAPPKTPPPPARTARDGSASRDKQRQSELKTPTVLLSPSDSSADFSEVKAAPKSQAVKSDPDSSTPRPAAGRKPTRDEPVAKTTPNTPTASVLVTGMSQAMLDPKITTHREATQPARSRPTMEQLRAAHRQPNILLWVMGAGGWVVAGVLAGVLVAQPNTPAVSEKTDVQTQTAITREQPAAPLATLTPPAATEIPPVAPTATEQSADEMPLAQKPKLKAPLMRSASRLEVATAPQAPKTNPKLESGLDGAPTPASSDVINSPGF